MRIANTLAQVSGRIGAALVLCLLATGPSAGQDDAKKQEFDAAKLVGNWKYIDGKHAGEPASDVNLSAEVRIDEKQIKIVNPDNADESFVFEYQVNRSKDPVEIDLKIIAGPVPEAKAIGIIKMSGDKFSLCYDPTGTKRPDKFESTAANGWHLFELAKKESSDGPLVGKWKYISGERAGEKVPDERLQSVVKVSNDKFVVPAGPDAEFVMSYKLDEKPNPMTIDLEIESGPAPEGKAVGIIKIESGKMSFCYDPTGAKRPTEFKTTSDNGYFLFVLERQAVDSEKKDEPKKIETSPDKK